MRSEYWCVRVSPKTTSELQDKVHSWDKCINIAIAEHINTEAIDFNIGFGIRTQIFKLDLVGTRQVKRIHMLYGISTKEEPVIAQKTISIFSVYCQSYISYILRVTSLWVSKLCVFEASATSIGKAWIRWAQSASFNRNKESRIIGINHASWVTLVNSVVIHLELVYSKLVSLFLEYLGLSLVIFAEWLIICENSLNHAIFPRLNRLHVPKSCSTHGFLAIRVQFQTLFDCRVASNHWCEPQYC